MTISTCVAGLVAEGRIPQGKAAEADRLYAKHFNVLKHTMGPSAAATEASERAIAALEAAAMQRKRQVLLLAKAQMDVTERLQAAAPIEADGRRGLIPKQAAFEEMRALDADMNAIAKDAHRMIAGLLAKHHRGLFGQVRNKTGFDNVLRELFGESTGDDGAKALAGTWSRTAEWLRSRFNAAGGAIPKLDTWGMPQFHNAGAVVTAGREAWKAFVRDRLDRAKMIDWETGLPMTDEALDELLGQVWSSIATNGWDRRNPGAVGIGSVGNQRQEHRVLHFASADDWLAYHKEFGGGATPLDVMLTHIRGMARDIAAMERMGPNPDATLRVMQGTMSKNGKEWLTEGGMLPEVTRWDRFFKGTQLHRAAGNALSASRHLDRIWNEYSGRNGISENPRLSLAFGTLSALQVAAKLGTTALRTGGDVGTLLKTASFNGLPIARMVSGYLGRIVIQSEADAMHAARFGVLAEDWTRIMHGDYRTSGEEITSEVARQMADTVLRASFLNRLSDAVRKTFATEMWNTISMERGKTMAELDPDFARMLTRNGIDAARWDALRATPLESYKGMDWIYPDRIEDEALRTAVLAMTHREGQHALITTDIDTRATVNALAPRGHIGGELVRSAFLFKAFPLTFMSLHGRRMMQESTLPAKLAYGFTLLAATTAGAAFYRQIWNLALFRDPEDMTDPGFLARSAFDGGGLGIYGDFIRSSENRFGGGFGGSLVGPLLGSTAGNVTSTLVGNTAAMIDGDPDTEAMWTRDLTNLAVRETPGLSLWYTRSAMDRLLIDQMREWSDPDYRRKITAAYRRAENEGTSYWAGPGALTGSGPPVRMPDFGNAIGMPSAPENVARREAAPN